MPARPRLARQLESRLAIAVKTRENGRMKRANVIVGIAVAVSLGAMLFGLLHHEMWRDELEAWLVARDSRGMGSLLLNVRYEQQFLWIFLLKALQVAARPFVGEAPPPSAMQAIHFLVAAANVVLIARFAPFGRLARAGLVLGYFVVYEYAVISRVYGLGLLVTLAFCVLWARSRNGRAHAGWLAILTSLLALVVIHYWIVAASLVIAVAVERVVVARGAPASRLELLALGLAVAGLCFPFVVLAAPPDSLYRDFQIPFSLEACHRTLSAVMRALFPVQPPVPRFWENMALDGWPAYVRARPYLGLALVVGASLSFLRRPSLFLFHAGATGVLLFVFLRYHSGNLRHHGILGVVLLAAIWLESSFATVRLPRALDRVAAFGEGFRRRIVPIVLAAQVVGAATALYADGRWIFSPARDVARLMVERRLESLPVVADYDLVTQSVAAYLPGRHEFYYPRSDRVGSFPRWSQGNYARKVMTAADFVEAAARQSGDRVVVLLGEEPKDPWPPTARIQRIATFPEAAAPWENYYLYLWER